jgi:hypothetical protein
MTAGDVWRAWAAAVGEMTASDWAAWVGAVAGVLALGWEIVKWAREGPRLVLHTSTTMRLIPDQDDRPILAVWVNNTGTAMTTLTTFAVMILDAPPWRNWRRLKVGKNWVAIENPMGRTLPVELAPGQQWIGGVRQDAEIAEAIKTGNLHVGIYHTFAKRPVLIRVPVPK